MAGAVAEEDGLDVQHGGDLRGHAADPAGVFQKVQVIHREVLAGVRHLLIEDRGGLLRGEALPAQRCGAHGQQPVAEAAAEGVHNMDEAAFVQLHQLLRREPGGVVGAADARAHGDIDDIPALRQIRREAGEEELRVEKGGLDDLAPAQILIKRVSVKVIHITPVGVLHAVNGIITGEKIDPLQHGLRQIGASVCKNDKRHGNAPFIRVPVCVNQ